MKKIYFAAPLFNQAELDFNLMLTKKLELLGFEVFLPQRDGIVICDEPYASMTKDELSDAIFDIDCKKVEECDIFLMILDGRVPDEGACVELGIAYSHKKLVNHDRMMVALKTDFRIASVNYNINPLVRVPLDVVYTETDSFLDGIKKQIN